MRFQFALGLAVVSLAGCLEAPPSGPLQSALTDTRLTLTEQGGDPAAGPMVMRLYNGGRGDMTFAGLELTYLWVTRGDRLCINDLRLDGMASSDPSEQCGKVSLNGDQITVDGLGPEQQGNRMSGTVTPL